MKSQGINDQMEAGKSKIENRRPSRSASPVSNLYLRIWGLPLRSLFWRLLIRSLSLRRPQAALAFGSLMVGAAVTSMLLNLEVDARRKMTSEFRAYGANVLVAGRDVAGLGGLIPEATLEKLRDVAPGSPSAPVLFEVVELRRAPSGPGGSNFQNVVAVGTDFSALRRIFPAWKAEADALDAASCAVGARLAARLGLRVGDPLELSSSGELSTGGGAPGHACRVATLVTSGASEDDQVFLPLAALQGLAGTAGRLTLIELRVPGETANVERAVRELARAFPLVEVRPVRQIVDSEGRILGIIRGLTVSMVTLIMFIILLCVAATMTTLILERRRDIAVMKALGAGHRTIVELFLSEGAVLGIAGGAAGYLAGALLAFLLARRMFDVSLRLVGWTFPAVCLASVGVAVAATLFPMRLARQVQPAVVLKGE